MKLLHGSREQRPDGPSTEQQRPFEQRLEALATFGRPDIPKRLGDDPVPLTPMQEQIWFQSTVDPDQPVYHSPIAFRLSGPLSEPALRAALHELVRRHDILRTRISTRNGKPRLETGPEFSVDVPVVDLTAVPDDGREDELQRRARDEVRRSFDLEKGPLVRATLFRLDEADHALVVTTHHLVMDGWSKAIFRRELAQLYEAVLDGQSSPLSPLPLEHADYAVWQHAQRRDGQHERGLTSWREHLANTATLDLPTVFPRPAVPRYQGQRYTFTIPSTLTAKIDTLSRAEDATLFMTLLGAFQVLLYRYTGQGDFAVGCPVSTRNRGSLQNLIGCFVNTLPLRADVASDVSFRTLLGRVRKTTLAALSRPAVSLLQLIEELRPERTTPHHPLYQVLFQLRNYPHEVIDRAGGLEWHSMTVDSDISLLDLSLELTKTETGLQATLEYSTDLFDRAAIKRMSGHYRTLLEGIVEAPDRSISALPLLTEKERRQLLFEWNATDTDAPALCVHELFEAQVERTPDAVALAVEDQCLTYRELNRRANQVAHFLRRQGVTPETLVALCIDRSPEMIVGLLGILKSGGAYVPLDPSYPAERLAFILRDTRAPFLLTRQALLDDRPAHEAKTIFLDADADTIEQEPESNPDGGATMDRLAYVIYTSGSTGRPKGVAVEHRSLSNLVRSVRREPGLNTDDVLMNVVTLAFDVATADVIAPLTIGAQLVLAPRAVASDGFRLAEALDRLGITTLTATPATWRLLLQAGWEGRPTLRIISGGEALDPVLAEALLERGAELWNLYGPTEATIWSTACRVDEPDDISIGRPIANTTVYVLDEALSPVPVGVPGELFIGGVGVARGYLNRPGLTAERFVPHPFSEAPDARLYRTGDRVRWRPDGALEYLGRTDHQVKLRGFRIELGEIETVLTEHPTVRQAVVTCDESTDEKRLVAYVTPGEEAPEPMVLRRFLKRTLPDYMVPATFVSLSEFPLTENGKVDRAALPVPDPDPGSTLPHEDITSPRSSLERTLVEIWGEALGTDHIGRRDNFFELGGHSLVAMRVLSRLRERLGLELSLDLLFTAPTIEDLAQAISKRTDC